MKMVFAILAALALPACAAVQTQGTPQAEAATARPPWVPVKSLVPTPPLSPPPRDRSRLPLPGDTGFAWDKLNHRGNVRWECRATPSGQFVRQSFCAGLAQAGGPRPESFRDLESWDGMVHDD